MLREGGPDWYAELWLEHLQRLGLADPALKAADSAKVRVTLLQLDSAQLGFRISSYKLGVLSGLDSAAGMSLRPYASRLVDFGALPPDPTRQFLRAVADTVLKRIGPTLIPRWDEATMRRVADFTYKLDDTPEGLARLDSMFSPAAKDALADLIVDERLRIGRTAQAQWKRLLDKTPAGDWEPPTAVEPLGNAVADIRELARATHRLAEIERRAAERIERAQL
jgi:hypothetical protein